MEGLRKREREKSCDKWKKVNGIHQLRANCSERLINLEWREYNKTNINSYQIFWSKNP